MALQTLQNFYKATITINWSTGAGNKYVDILPTPTAGRLVISPSDTSKREIISYSGKGTDVNGNYITVTARGVAGTTDQQHFINELVRMNITAEHYADIQTELTTLDSEIDAVNAAKVSLTGAETVAGIKTFSSSPIVPTPTTDMQVATKKYADDLAIAGSPDASETVKGIVEEATSAEIADGTSTGSTGARLFINPKDTGTTGANKVIKSNTSGEINIVNTGTDSISISHLGQSLVDNVSLDSLVKVSRSGPNFKIEYPGKEIQYRAGTDDWSVADDVISVICIGSYLYVALIDQATLTMRIYRYEKNNLAGGGTLMTISGQSFGTTSGFLTASNGTNFYMTAKAGNSTNKHIISKYTLSGTTLTYVSDITCGSTSGNFDNFLVDNNENFYGYNSGDGFFRKYNSSGTLQYTTSGTYSLNARFMNLKNNFFIIVDNDPIRIYSKIYFS